MSPSPLPFQLVHKIIHILWLSLLTSQERVHLMTALPLVNTAFHDIYLDLSFKDTYIPRPSRISGYLKTLLEDYLDRLKCEFLNQPPPFISPGLSCRSLTIIHDVTGISPHVKAYGSRTTHEQIIFEAHRLSVMISALPYVPNVRKLRVEFFDASVLDVLDHLAFLSLPQQVELLELEISYSSQLMPTREEAVCIAKWRDKGRPIDGIRCRLDRLSFPWLRKLVLHAREEDVTDVAEVLVPKCRLLQQLVASHNSTAPPMDVLAKFKDPDRA